MKRYQKAIRIKSIQTAKLFHLSLSVLEGRMSGFIRTPDYARIQRLAQKKIKGAFTEDDLIDAINKEYEALIKHQVRTQSYLLRQRIDFGDVLNDVMTHLADGFDSLTAHVDDFRERLLYMVDCSIRLDKLTRPPKKGLVYFVEAENGLVKVGFTRDVRTRFNALNTSSPINLTLIGTIEANELLEIEIHNLLTNSRVRGEWFAPSPRLSALIELYVKPKI